MISIFCMCTFFYLTQVKIICVSLSYHCSLACGSVCSIPRIELRITRAHISLHVCVFLFFSPPPSWTVMDQANGVCYSFQVLPALQIGAVSHQFLCPCRERKGDESRGERQERRTSPIHCYWHLFYLRLLIATISKACSPGEFLKHPDSATTACLRITNERRTLQLDVCTILM